jgi:hypothetical protein
MSTEQEKETKNIKYKTPAMSSGFSETRTVQLLGRSIKPNFENRYFAATI